MYPLGTWFVPEICVWLPCIKETMMIIIIIIRPTSPHSINGLVLTAGSSVLIPWYNPNL